MFDKIKDAAQKAVSDNPDKVEEFSDKGIDAAGDLADDKTGGQYADKIDQGQEFADGKIGNEGSAGGDDAQQ